VIALNLIAERVKQEMPEIPEVPTVLKSKRGRTFRRIGNKIVME